MIYDAIKNFNKQFEFEPKIENGDSVVGFDFKNFVVAGMGGSHLAADILKCFNPYLKIIIHNDYGLPPLTEEEFARSLIILSSYSGNTEEIINAYEKATEKGLSKLSISTGGKLLKSAKKEKSPYIQLPDTGIQPRSALGFFFKATLKAMGEERQLKEATELGALLDPFEKEHDGKELAGKLWGFVPVIYSSSKNAAIALNWKIKLNEGAKIPAFYNILPELNHNEMTGFDRKESTWHLSQNFYFIFLTDPNDHPSAIKRMAVLKNMLVDRKFQVETVALAGQNLLHKIFSSLILADWVAYYLAKAYGVEPENVPMVEEFKKLIS